MQARFTVLLTLTIAVLISLIPLTSAIEPYRPDWVALALLYWCIAAPRYCGVTTGFLFGLVEDVLFGSLLGAHALTNSLLAYIAVKLHLRIRMFPLWQQSALIFFLLAFAQLIQLWVRGATGRPPFEPIVYWIPSVLGAALWPVVLVLLRNFGASAHTR